MDLPQDDALLPWSKSTLKLTDEAGFYQMGAFQNTMTNKTMVVTAINESVSDLNSCLLQSSGNWSALGARLQLSPSLFLMTCLL